MNDLDRWVNLQGPEPPDVRKLFDAVRGDPEWMPERTPEQEAELDRRVFAAVAADRRRAARERAAKRVVKAAMGVGAVCLLAAGSAGAFVLVDALRGMAPPASLLSTHVAPLTSEPTSFPSATPSAAPSVSGKAPPPRRRGPGR